MGYGPYMPKPLITTLRLPDADESAQVLLYRQEMRRIEPILVAHQCPREALAMALGANCGTERELAEFVRIMQLGYLCKAKGVL